MIDELRRRRLSWNSRLELTVGGQKRPVSVLKATKTIKGEKGDDGEQGDVQMDEFIRFAVVNCWSNILVSNNKWMDGWMMMKRAQKETRKPVCIPYILRYSRPASPQQSGMTPPSRGPETRREIRPSRQYLEAKFATGGVAQQ